MKKDCQLHRIGKYILGQIADALHQVQHLETLCSEHQDTIIQCETKLESVAVDIACLSTGGGEWDEMSLMMREAGIPIPEDLDEDMRQMMAGNDSCLD